MAIWQELEIEYDSTDHTWRFYLVLYEQPVWRRAVAWLYHRYDMNRLVHAVAHRIERPYGEVGGSPFTMPLCALQDERCDDLVHRARTDVVRLSVDLPTYRRLGGQADGLC